MANPIAGVNVLVAVGSPDGMAGAAACLRHAANPNVKLVFTQAFQVNTIDVTKWPECSKVGFIDLAVNNAPNQQLTVDFVSKVYQSGHTILFIADEHGKSEWNKVLEACNHSAKELSIRPKDRGDKYPSSCAILLKKLGEAADEHTKALLEDGNQADLMNYNTHFGAIFNEGVKSNMTDPERRPHMVAHLAQQREPDDKINKWMAEYAEMKANVPRIFDTRKDLGAGISLYDCTIGAHDATALFNEFYKTSPIVVLKGTRSANGTIATIGTNRRDFNIMEVLKKGGVSSTGMSARANIALDDLEKAIEALRE